MQRSRILLFLYSPGWPSVKRREANPEPLLKFWANFALRTERLQQMDSASDGHKVYGKCIPVITTLSATRGRNISPPCTILLKTSTRDINCVITIILCSRHALCDRQQCACAPFLSVEQTRWYPTQRCMVRALTTLLGQHRICCSRIEDLRPPPVVIYTLPLRVWPRQVLQRLPAASKRFWKLAAGASRHDKRLFAW